MQKDLNLTLSDQLVSHVMTHNYICMSHDRTIGAGVPGFPTSLSSARATILLNLCSVYCIRKDYEMAKKALQQVIILLTTTCDTS